MWMSGTTTGKIDIDSSSILFGVILQTQVTAELFDAGLQLLDMIDGMTSFANHTIITSDQFLSHSLPSQSSTGWFIDHDARLTREDGDHPVPVQLECAVPGCPQPPARTARVSRWCRTARDREDYSAER